MAKLEGDQLWCSRDEIAGVFGIKAKSFDAGPRKLLPRTGPHLKSGRRPLFLASAYLKAWHEAELAKSVKAAGGDDLLIGGGDGSPALERYRDERAKMARLDRLEREGSLLPRQAVHDQLARLASILRSAGETIERHYGHEPNAILEKALKDFEREVQSLSSGDGGDGSNL